MTSAPAPEVAADLPDRIVRALLDNQTRVRKLFRRWLVVASLIVGIGMGYNSWQSHDSNVTVNKVRTSQVANTRVSNHRAQCDQTAYSDLIYDLTRLVSPGETPKEFLAQVKIPGPKC